MPAVWEGIILRREKTRSTPRRSSLKLVLRWRIYEEGALVFEQEDEVVYPLHVFNGMDRDQVRRAIIQDGVNGGPSLRDLGALILHDWNSAHPFRGIDFPVTFGP